MGGKKNQQMNQTSKQICEFLMKNKCTLTAEYIPSALNIEADQESRTTDYSEWKLNPQQFQYICKQLGMPEVDLFASLCIPSNTPDCQIHVMKTGLKSNSSKCSANKLGTQVPICLSTIQTNRENSQQNKIPPHLSDHCYTSVVNCHLVPNTSPNGYKKPLTLPQNLTLLTDPMGVPHPLLKTGKLRLAAWLVSGQDSKIKEYQRNLPITQSKDKRNNKKL